MQIARLRYKQGKKAKKARARKLCIGLLKTAGKGQEKV